MKKGKFYGLQRIFTTVATSLLFLQVAVPTGVALATEIDSQTAVQEISQEDLIEQKISSTEETINQLEKAVEDTTEEKANTEETTTSSESVEPVIESSEENTTEETTDQTVSTDSESSTTEENSTSESIEPEFEKTDTSAEVTESSVEEKSDNKKAAEEGSMRASAMLDNIYRLVSITIADQEIKDGDVINIGEGTLATVKFAWDTLGQDAKAGDTASVQLADTFKFTDINPQPILVEGVEVGTYVIVNGLVTVTFNEQIEKDNVHNGFLEMDLEFNLNKFNENVKQEIPFSEDSDKNLTIIAKPNLTQKGIKKTGEPDSKENPRNLNWSVDVLNTSEESISNAHLDDHLPEGVSEATNIQIIPLTVGLNGSLHEGEPTNYEGSFPIKWDSMGPYEGYRVKYVTPITDIAVKSFTNNANASLILRCAANRVGRCA